MIVSYSATTETWKILMAHQVCLSNEKVFHCLQQAHLTNRDAAFYQHTNCLENLELNEHARHYREQREKGRGIRPETRSSLAVKLLLTNLDGYLQQLKCLNLYTMLYSHLR